jgi:hypothetical protein
MVVCGGGSLRFPYLLEPIRDDTTIEEGLGCSPQDTPHLSLSPSTCIFTTFSSVVGSLAKLVIEDQEPLEDIWYDQYNVLHCDSCHVLHLILVLILSL